MSSIMQDLRYSARRLARSPGFTLTAALTLALGIGGTTMIFSMVNATLLRPFAYPDADRLVVISSVRADRPGHIGNLSYPDFLDMRSGVDALEEVAVWDWEPFNLRGDGPAAFVGGGYVTAGFFDVIGLQPVLGRTFRPEEDRPGGPDVVVLSEGLWRQQFGGDREMVGRSVVLDGTPHTVIGVMPDAVALPEQARLWVPLATSPEESPRGNSWLGGIGRLRAGASQDLLRSQLESLASRLQAEHAETNRERGFRAISMREDRSADVRPAFLLLLGSVGFVLLIACANIANLLLARGAARERELAVRSALGAGRTRLARQLLIESLVLGVIGCTIGYLLGQWAVSGALAMIPVEIPAWIQLEVDHRILAFTAAISLGAVALFGLPPAIQASRADLERVFRETGGRGTGARRQRRFQSGLVVAEVALSLALLIGAGLMIRSFVRLAAVDPGFETGDRVMATTALAPIDYSGPEPRRQFVVDVLGRLDGLPGVRSAGAISRFPLRGSSNQMMFSVEGQSDEDYHHNPFVLTSAISPGYLETMGIRLLEGRRFTAADREGAARVAIVNDELARRYWPDESAVGKRIKFGGPTDAMPWMEVVGVVGSVRHFALEDRPGLQMYLPLDQSPSPRISFVVHAASGAGPTLPATLRREVAAVDPNQALYDIITLERVVSESIWDWRFFTVLFWAFAAIALTLAAVGLYGVIAQAVARRTQEIGVRVALGADGGDVLRFVLRQGLTLVALGLGIGLILSFGISRLMSGLLFEIGPADPLIFAAVPAILLAVGAAACLLPALRAVRVDPLTALRYE